MAPWISGLSNSPSRLAAAGGDLSLSRPTPLILHRACGSVRNRSFLDKPSLPHRALLLQAASAELRTHCGY